MRPAELPVAVRRRLGAVALGTVLVATLALVLGTPARGSFLVPAGVERFPAWLGGTLAGRSAPLRSDGYSLLLLLMCAGYAGALACAREIPAGWAAGAVVAAHALLALAPPLLSADVFGYLAYARLGVLHGADPYLVAPEAMPGDPVMPFVRWRYLPSPYGPLWTLGSYPLALLGLPGALWTLKALAGAAGIALAGLVGAGARRLGRPPVPAALLVGLNPVLLVWGVGGGHNDLLVTAVAVGGVTLALAGREGLGAAVVVAATALKASAGLLLPFLLLGARRPGRAALVALAAGAVVTLGALVAFGPGVGGYLSVLARQSAFVSRHSVPNEIGKLLGLGGVTPSGLRVAVTPALRLITGAVFVAAIGWLAWRTRRGADWLASATWATAALLATTTFLLPWYLVWLLPLAALAPGRAPAGAALALTAFVVITRTPLLLA